MKTSYMNRCLLIIAILLSITSSAQIGVIINYAGTGVNGYTGDGGQATSAQIGLPIGAAVDKQGNFYFVHSNIIRKISFDGIITTVAGNGIVGYSGDDSSALIAALYYPTDVIVDSADNLFIADVGNHRIRKVDAITGIITTYAGNGNQADTGDGNQALNAAISFPSKLAIDQNYNLFVTNGYGIRKIDNGGFVSTYQSTGAVSGIFIDKNNNLYHFANGYLYKQSVIIGGIGSVSGPLIDNVAATNVWIDAGDLAVDDYGNVFLADQERERIRRIDPLGTITTVAGGGSGFTDGALATQVSLVHPGAIALDSCGNMYIGDWNYHIRKVTYSVCNELSVSTADNKLSLKLSPNPATSQFSITANTTLRSVTVINALGSIVKEIMCNSQNVAIDMSELLTGMYFIKVTDENGFSGIEKVIKL